MANNHTSFDSLKIPKQRPFETVALERRINKVNKNVKEPTPEPFLSGGSV